MAQLSVFSNGFEDAAWKEFQEDLERFRPEFGGRSLQQEYNRNQGMVRSPAQDQACKLMGEGQR